MRGLDRPRRRPRRHRGGSPKPCRCLACVHGHALWRERVARARAAGVTLWQFVLCGPALAESMVIVTDDPERCADALNAETIAVLKLRPEQPMAISTMPLPPALAWRDPNQLAKVQ